MRFLSVLVLSFLAGLGGAQAPPEKSPEPVALGSINCKVAPWVCIFFIRVLKALPTMIIIDVGHGQAPPGNCHPDERIQCQKQCDRCHVKTLQSSWVNPTGLCDCYCG
ncbi:hypothetical protein Alg215_00926 [Pyrenophora tritici-repentis]|nr:hypothetical protein Alg215_00926 [Pyrenophora tritici-repentis]